MKTLEGFLSELRQRDVTLWLDGDRLRYRAAKDALTPDLLAQLKARKAEVIEFLRQASAQLPPIQPIERNGHLPLSFAQQRLWFLHQFEPEGTSNNMPVVVRFTGSLDVVALEESIQAVVCRHEVLRTRFPAVNGQPTLVIEDEINVTLPLIDLRQLPDQERDAEALKLATQEARQPFDLSNGPILRVKLFRLRDDEHLLIWNMHCIVCDGASSDVFYQDLTAIYQSLVTGEPSPLSDLPVQYVDFAHWQRQWLQGEVLESQVNHWKQTLAGDLPVLQLPFDYPRPTGVQTYRGDRAARMLPLDLNDSLNSLSQQLGVSLFMMLLAVFEVLLYRYTGQDDMLTSFASAGRGQVETERLVGFFSNTLMLRTDFQGNPTFRELLNRVKAASLQAYAHQDLPFEKLVEELRPEQGQRRSPLFQTKFSLNPPWSKGRGMASVQLPALTIKSLFGYIYHGKTKYDLALVMREQDEGLGMVFDYNAEMFDPSTIGRMLNHFQTLLEGIVANPDQRISDLPFLTPQEQQQLLIGWNPPPVHSQPTSITEQFEAQVRQAPEAIALVTPDQALTYAALNQQANQLARHLQSLGITAGTQVGLYFDRSIAAILSILAVLKTGATYIPLSPEASSASISHILANAQAAWVLTENRLMDGLVDYPNKILCWEEVQPVLPQYSSDNLTDSIQPDCIAYVLYPQESGAETNSVLRGVSISHGAVVDLATRNTLLNLSPADVLLQFATLSSEIAVFEIFSALLNGCKLAIYPAIVPLQQLGPFIQAQQVTTLWLPTRLFHHLVDHQLDHCKSIRNFLTGGDILSISYARKLQAALPHCSLLNTYSFPENTALTCSYAIPESIPSNAPMLMGRPVGNTQVYVLDKHLKPLPVGAIGELYLSGPGLAQGYFKQPEETEKRFIHNPFSSEPASRLYKTNYHVRYLPDSNLEFLGQIDQPVTIRGYQIELGEIETALSQHAAVQQCVVTVRADEQQDQYLVAYVVATEPEASSAVELRQFLQKNLPDYMIPAAFIYLESLPLTPNGKIDQQALPQPSAADLQASNRYVAPRTPLEQQIADIWCEIFKMEQIGIYDNFFNLGGHSLLAISLVSAVEDTLQKPMPLAALYQVTTIADMAYFLEQGETEHLDETSDDLPPLSKEVLRSILTVVAGRQGGKPRPDSLITSMRTSGSKPPLFFCANRLLELSSLVSYLSEEQPVYFLAVGGYALAKLPPEQRPETIQAIAARHVRDMLTIHPDGPYLLAGYCFGSVMAYEIAKQLQAKGKQVIFYGALDYEGIGRRYSHYLKEVEPLMVDVKKYLLNGSLIQFIFKVNAILCKIKDNFTLKDPVLPLNLEDICMQGYTGKVTLFVPTEQEIRYNQAFRQFLFPRKGWEEHAVDLVKLAGTHMSIVYGTGDEDNNNIVYSDHLTRCYDDVREAANKLQTKIDEALVAFAHTK